jgi:aspartate aminotransferase-like enzyme
MKLFTAGPVACYPEILKEMSLQMFSHRSEDYKNLHKVTVEKLQNFLETKNNVFLVPSTGTGIMEGSVRNCVEKKMLCCINGSFGKRYGTVAEANGKQVERLTTELGHPIKPDMLDEKLTATPDVEAVSITHNETSIGLLNHLQDLAKVVKKNGKLLFVDAVSSLGGTEIKVDEWQIDVCFASSQKCFGLPPGLAVGSVSEAALDKSEKAKNKGWYFDFKLFEEYQTKLNTPMTPVIPQIAALKKALEMVEMNGREAQFELYRKRSLRIRRGVEKLGLTLFPKPGYESPTITCVNAPPHINGLEVYNKMREKGFELAKGYRDLQERTFRIGNMGYVPFEDIDLMLNSLEEILEKGE